MARTFDLSKVTGVWVQRIWIAVPDDDEYAIGEVLDFGEREDDYSSQGTIESVDRQDGEIHLLISVYANTHDVKRLSKIMARGFWGRCWRGWGQKTGTTRVLGWALFGIKPPCTLENLSPVCSP